MASITDIAVQVYVNPNDRRIALAMLSESGFIKNFETQMRKKDGALVWVSMNARLNKSTDGSIGLEGFVTDITERKRTEDALQENEGRLRAMFEASRDAIGVAKKGVHIFANPSYLKLFGFENDDKLVGTSILNCIAPRDRQMMKNNIEQRSAGEPVPKFYETRGLRVDGTEFDAEFSVTTYELNSEIYSLAVIRDFTERKLAEDKLRESEEKFRILTEKSIEGIYILQGAKMVYVNPSLAHMFGYTSEEVVDVLGLEGLIHPEDIQSVMERLQDRLNGVILKKRFTTKGVKKDGSLFYIESYSIKIEYQGKPAIMGMVMDITDLRKSQEQAREQQMQLIQADKMTSLGVLVSGIAHEINNPNNLVMFNSDLVGRIAGDVMPILNEYYEAHPDRTIGGLPFRELRIEFESLVKGISTGAQRIRDIVSGLKDFARIDAGNLQQKVMINDAVKSSLLIVGNLIRKSTDHFSVEYGEQIRPIKGNIQQIEQVIINLLTNACQALPDRDRPLRVRTALDTKLGVVRIIVSDEGVGISKENMKRMFDPFFTTKREQGGTGLGLSVSYTIIQAHHGDLQIESEEGKGTIVTLVLPIAENMETL